MAQREIIRKPSTAVATMRDTNIAKRQATVPTFPRPVDRVETDLTVNGQPVIMYVERPRTRWLALAGWTFAILAPVTAVIFTVCLGFASLVSLATTRTGGLVTLALSGLGIASFLGARKLCRSTSCGCPGIHCPGCDRS